MLNWKDPRVFYEHGNYAQYEYVLSLYKEAINYKCEQKKKPAELQKLDAWYQDELPRIVDKRKPDKFLIHDEMVQCIKWKLARGKFRPRLKELVQMNTPRVVQVETKKAYRKLYKQDVQSAIQALSNLKGVGPAFASAVLAAMAPEKVPFMADECIMAINNVATIDYTLKEYMQFVDQVNGVCERLNKEGSDSEYWTPHRVELSLWTHYVLVESNPSLLDKVDDLASAKPGAGVIDPAALKKAAETKSGALSVNGNGNHADDDLSNKSVPVYDEDSRSSANGDVTASSASSAVDDESSRDSAGGKVESPKVDSFVFHGENGDASNDSGVMNHANSEAVPVVLDNHVLAPSEDSSHGLLSSAHPDYLVHPVVHDLVQSSAVIVDSSSDSAVDLCDTAAGEKGEIELGLDVVGEPEMKRARLEENV